MAEPNKQESNVSSSGNDSDQDFDPTAEMLVNEFDDEHTMDEEEALGDDDHFTEIEDLTKEQNIPIEELLAMYGYNNAEQPKDDATNTTADNNKSSNNQTSTSASASSTTANQQQLQPSQGPLTNLSDSSDDDSDEDFSVNEDEWRRVIQVGSDFQAVIPDGLKHYDTNDPGFNDKFLWKPSPSLSITKIDDYLLEYAKSSLQDDDSLADFELPSGSHIKDDEQALYTLINCKYDIKEALRHHEKGQEPKAPISEQMTPWTEEECRAFESGLRQCGKDFFQIKYSRIPTRTVGEVISFYYLWKKTERHDIFANKYRMEKKKYSLHPGTTDYMDRFLDEQEYASMNMMQQQQPQNQQQSCTTSSNSITITPTNSTSSSSSSNLQQQQNHSTNQNNNNNRQSLINSSHRHHQSSYNSSNNLLSSMANNRTSIVNVSATDKPQTILISDSDFVCSPNEKPIVVCSGSSSGSSHQLNPKANYYNKSSSMLNFKNSGSSSQSSSSSSSNTTTIVVGKNPVLIDGNWMSSSSSSSQATPSNMGTSSSNPNQSMIQPSVSIFKVNPNTNHHHSTFHR